MGTIQCMFDVSCHFLVNQITYFEFWIVKSRKGTIDLTEKKYRWHKTMYFYKNSFKNDENPVRLLID